ncbi:MAG: hypothetical protein EA397_02320 [Deltaproteobacteria bacterium]|nr:MAG: hypothetical protein EA397_02320 [Deltaproteobacteria bacterium]
MDLESGEILLQWLAPSATSRLFMALKRSRLASWVLVAGALALGVPLWVCLGLLDPVLFVVIGVLVMGGAALGSVAPFIYELVARPQARWWVTSRRVVVDEGGDPVDYDLGMIQDVKVAPPHEIRLILAGRVERLRWLDALPQLWGALQMGRALRPLSFPEILVEQPETTVPSVVCWWANARRGASHTPGVLVLRKDRLAWVPGQTSTLAGKAGLLAKGLVGAALGFSVRSIYAQPPLDALFYRLLRLKDPTEFDEVLCSVIRAWGGFVHLGAEGLSVNARDGGEDVTFTDGDLVLHAPGVDHHPDWPEVRAALLGSSETTPRTGSVG